MQNRYYVTTPIYYVNDIPHIGHTYTTLAADILARFHRDIKDEKTLFLTGTDEHGAKIAEAARENGKTPKEYCDEIAPRFRNAWEKLNISFDYFIRTTNPKHEEIVKDFIQKVKDNGYIEKRLYEGLYCVGCEKFLTESDLVEGKCPLHPNKTPIKQSEENYFFNLSSFKNILLRLIKNNEFKISPEQRRNEILGKLELGLDDISISRVQVEWGIPIPWDEKQTIYVWFDALINYYSAPIIINTPEFWPANLHIVGKDILWFHTVIWPAMLIAKEFKKEKLHKINDTEVKKYIPAQVFAHGYFTSGGKKMSKSLGNVISPWEMIKKFDVDATRYLLFIDIPFGADGDITWERLIQNYNTYLANGLGNTVQRLAKVCENKGVTLPQLGNGEKIDRQEKYEEMLENLNFHEYLAWTNETINNINAWINSSKPWEWEKEKLEIVMSTKIIELREVATLLKPFMPTKAEEILKVFSGKVTAPKQPLFPRIV